MNDNEKGYVTPTPVDTSGEVVRTDTLLSREKDNIINATNQANNSIDEVKAVETNNKYNVKNISFIVRFISIVLSLVLVFFVAFYAIKYAKKFIEAGEVPTQTTTTSSPLERSKEYWNKNAVRRYEDNEGTIYLFIPEEYGKYVYVISKDADGISSLMGTYDDNDVSLTMDDIYEYSISDKGIKLGDKELTIKSGEFKYYTYKDDTSTSMLLVNASTGLLQGVYINNNSSIEGKYMEYEDRIVLTTIQGEIVFQKEGNTVTYNGVKMALSI